MSAADKWTPQHLRSPADRAIHLEQRRQQLLPIVDDLRRLAREMEAEIKEIDSIEGDVPGQAWLRARHVAKPLFRAADDVERTLADLVAFNARYHRSYEELPVKRAEKRKKKELAKGGQQAIEAPAAGDDSPGSGESSQFGALFDGLRKGA